jgi:hypothetical protein
VTRRLGAAVLLAALAGCSHAKTTDAGKPEKQSESGGESKPAAEERKRAPRAEPAASKPGDVPVATSPAGLLAPGADDKIRDRLAERGFASEGKSTKEAMRRFQQANDLPATGVPDHETVKKLGLDPDVIFRAGAVKD